MMNQNSNPYDDIDLNEVPDYDEHVVINTTTTTTTTTNTSTNETKCTIQNTSSNPILQSSTTPTIIISIEYKIPHPLFPTTLQAAPLVLTAPVVSTTPAISNTCPAPLVKIENSRTSGKPTQEVKTERLVRPVPKATGIVKMEHKMKTEKQLKMKTEQPKIDPKAEDQNQKAMEIARNFFQKSIPNKHLDKTLNSMSRQKKH